jgi:probable O-glycosylation ligase (exosortase A-associated)
VHAVAAAAPDARWDLLMVCLAGHILTGVGRLHQLFTVVGAVRPAIITGLLAIVLYAHDPLEERRFHRVVGPTTKFLLALTCWMVLCIPGALVAGNSFDLVFGSFVKTALMCVLIAAAVRGVRDVERLALAYLASATAYAGVVITRFDLGGGSDWRLGRLYYYDANDLATFLVTAMPLGFYFIQAGRGLRTRLFAAVALIVMTVAFVRTGSRGGFIALIAVALFIVVRYSAIPLGRRVFVTAVVAAIVVGTASTQYWEQMGTIVSDTDYNRTDESGRMQIWSRGLGYMLGNPLFGVGPNNFQTAEGTLSPYAERQQFGVGVRWNAAHNSYLQVGAELGVVGLALFVAVLFSAVVALHRSQPTADAAEGPRDQRRQLAQVLTASLIGFIVGAFFLSLAYSDMLYTLVAMAVGMRKATMPADSAETAPAFAVRPRPRLAR